MSTAFWFTPLPPVLAFLALALGVNRKPSMAAGCAILGAGLSLVLSGIGLWAAVTGAHASWGVPWLNAGGFRFEWAFLLDPLSALGAVLVSLLCFVVFAYARSAFSAEAGQGRLFTWLSLFCGSMLVLVLAADLLTLFIAWELVGLCSYLLIGHRHAEEGVPAAASKALLVTRVGDLCLLLGILLIVGATGTARIDALSSDMPAVAILLVILGAAAKSAQFPFQGWLPDAMKGPTPVSALLHSATMVAAGVFLLARLSPLLQAHAPLHGLVAWMGVLTALLGGAAALAQRELKRTLAYSTLSQLGFMFLGLGAGSLLAAVLLLVCHAFYKALLFLAAGRVAHAVGSGEYARMGRLGSRMRATFAAFLVGTLALSGLPATLALPPKEAALAAAHVYGEGLFIAALLAGLLTALYSTRMVARVFLGRSSEGTERVPREPRGHGLRPMVALSVLVPVALMVNARMLGHPLSEFLGVATPSSSSSLWLGLAVAALGVTLGLFRSHSLQEDLVLFARPLTSLLATEFGCRQLYRAVASSTLRAVEALGRFDAKVFDAIAGKVTAGARQAFTFAGHFDARVFDALAGKLAAGARWAFASAGRFEAATFERLASTSARGVLALVGASRRFDQRAVERGVNGLAQGVFQAGGGIRPVQTGRVDNYLLIAFGWVAGAVAIAVIWLVAT